ncbi:hypothetical protein [Paracoccus sp. N5]|uniref:hypothetical protein n=1 Tax=Paracoccus sp. N5 TaxID=1101189 RepID=UPI001E30A52C|nr:hypothetical protein [Paracoccus sp. N5]
MGNLLHSGMDKVSVMNRNPVKILKRAGLRAPAPAFRLLRDRGMESTAPARRRSRSRRGHVRRDGRAGVEGDTGGRVAVGGHPKCEFHALYADHHGWFQGWLRGQLATAATWRPTWRRTLSCG